MSDPKQEVPRIVRSSEPFPALHLREMPEDHLEAPPSIEAIPLGGVRCEERGISDFLEAASGKRMAFPTQAPPGP